MDLLRSLSSAFWVPPDFCDLLERMIESVWASCRGPCSQHVFFPLSGLVLCFYILDGKSQLFYNLNFKMFGSDKAVIS
jgi:hypothetical protein